MELLKDHTMKIEMHKKSEKVEDTEQFHRVERYSGVMRRIFSLPDNVKEDEIDANVTDGVLHINIPKIPGLKEDIDQFVKKIEVK